jgi:hypothetical protein
VEIMRRFFFELEREQHFYPNYVDSDSLDNAVIQVLAIASKENDNVTLIYDDEFNEIFF